MKWIYVCNSCGADDERKSYRGSYVCPCGFMAHEYHKDHDYRECNSGHIRAIKRHLEENPK